MNVMGHVDKERGIVIGTVIVYLDWYVTGIGGGERIIAKQVILISTKYINIQLNVGIPLK